MQKLAEWPLPNGADRHRNAFRADQRGIDRPFRLAVAARRALEQFGRRRHVLSELGLRERVDRILEIKPGRVGKRARRIERRLTPFVEPVERSRRTGPLCSGSSGGRPNSPIGMNFNALNLSLCSGNADLSTFSAPLCCGAGHCDVSTMRSNRRLFADAHQRARSLRRVQELQEAPAGERDP